MRLIVARCSAIYSGRLDTILPEALRLIMVKADGRCFSTRTPVGTSR